MAETISEGTKGGDVHEGANVYQAGNEADFERLYQGSYGKILGTLTAMLGDRAAAEDCAQDAFERAYKKWPTWQPLARPKRGCTASPSTLRFPTSGRCGFARSVR